MSSLAIILIIEAKLSVISAKNWLDFWLVRETLWGLVRFERVLRVR